jgi:tetratricopeptide (TPR) repeat protein
MSRICVFYFLAITAGLNVYGQSTPDRTAEWKALRQAGAKQFDATNLTAADALFTRALEIARVSGNPAAIVRTLEELGILYYRSIRYPEAKRCFEEVMGIAKTTPSLEVTAVALAYNYIGLTERDLGNYAASIEWHKRALEILLNNAPLAESRLPISNLLN